MYEVKYIANGGYNMSYLFLEYPKCSTCKKAKNWLDDNSIKYNDRHIVENRPSAQELTMWINKSGFPIKKFFNTSGILYKEMNLKDKLNDMSDEEKIELLSTNGMLVKRPLIIGEEIIIVGFQPEKWEQLK